MPEKKKHHFVPQFVLKNFADENNTLVMYQRDKSIFNENIPYMSQCQKDYFYGKDKKIENLFSEFEGIASNIVKDVINATNFGCVQSKLYYYIIQVFIVSQYLRTKGMLNRRKNSINRFERDLQEIIHQFHEVYDHYETDEEALERLSPHKTDEEIIIENVYAAFSNINEYKDLFVVILDNKSNTNFILSDDPVIDENYYFLNYTYGLGSCGVLYFYPISPKKAMLLVDARAYFDRNNYSDYIVIGNDQDILKINTWQFARSKLLYSIDRNSLEETVQRNNLYIINNYQYAKDFLLKDIAESKPFLSMGYIEKLVNEKLSTKDGFNDAIHNYVKYENIPSFLHIKNRVRKSSKYLWHNIPLRKDMYGQ
jgi:hypothetical protein